MQYKKPNLFIVGAAKSGTSALIDIFSRHPEICVPTFKELHFFGNDLSWESLKQGRPPPRTGSKLMNEKYLHNFTGCWDCKYIAEKSVGYLFSINAAREIKEFNSSAKIIIQLRNPVDMMHAMHWHMLFHRGVEFENDFFKALDLEGHRSKGNLLPKNVIIPSSLFYFERSLYYKQVKRYIDTFGKENVFVSKYEDFREDPNWILEGLEKFLGVEGLRDCDNRYVNVARVNRIPALHKLLNTDSSARKAIISCLPRKMYSTMRKLKRWVENKNTIAVPRPRLSKDDRKILYTNLAEDIEKLEELLGKNLSSWKEA